MASKHSKKTANTTAKAPVADAVNTAAECSCTNDLFHPTVEQFKDSITTHLRRSIGTSEKKASPLAWWQAVVYAVNELVFERLTQTQFTHASNDTRAVNYLSAEFLMGRLTVNNMCNLEVYDTCKKALAELGIDINELCDEEPDMALGNGGLGRLAACYIDSLATLKYPSIGYGLHYENGLFRQEIRGGRQVERPDSWREYGCPWEVCRPESTQEIPVGGYVEVQTAPDGTVQKVWHPAHMIKGVPWDIPVVGFRGASVTVLRLWESRATEQFNWDVFNAGGYVDAQEEKAQCETISKVLYPNDSTEAGKMLRLTQQYFFCACSLKDILRRYNRAHHHDYSSFASKIAIQLNDTHPTIAVPELMRLLIDEEGLSWDAAWKIVTEVFAYTNHTLLPEALEKWPVYLFERLLPRHLEIIYEINARFLDGDVERMWPGDNEKRAKLSIIEEGPCRMVRMANLCVIASRRVNGVAEIHSKLVREQLFPEFAAIWPDRFCNVTNGVTPRRWLLACNPGLAELYNEVSGKDWPLHLESCAKMRPYADNADFRKRFMDVKHANKVALAAEIKKLCGVDVDPNALFDVQVKRLHEYKRQQMNALYAIYKYLEIKAGKIPARPITMIFGAKAAPAYTIAKDIIHLILCLSQLIENDPQVSPYLKVVMVENYNVTKAEKLIPACDISEQISLASKEASGTGNMKFMLNGALTLGTRDGANVEIAELVGEENIYSFGKNSEEVIRLYDEQAYSSAALYDGDEEIARLVDFIIDKKMIRIGDVESLCRLYKEIVGKDWFMTLLDVKEYIRKKEAMLADYEDELAWSRKTLVNIAKAGFFSSDRTIAEYNQDIWHL